MAEPSKYLYGSFTITVSGQGLPVSGLSITSDSFKGDKALLNKTLMALDELFASSSEPKPLAAVADVVIRDKVQQLAEKRRRLLQEAESTAAAQEVMLGLLQ